jgi:predicted nucleotidyltransferase
MPAQLPVNLDAIRRLCRKHHIRRLAMFGSAVRDDFTPDSDVDLLVEFEPDHVPGLEFITIQDEFSDLFGRPVDLITFKSLNRRLRNDVLASAETLYAKE